MGTRLAPAVRARWGMAGRGLGSALLASACAGDAGAPTTEPQQATGVATHALVVVLDGVRLEESLGVGTTDVLGRPTDEVLPSVQRELLPEGTVVTGVLSVGPTVTAPAHLTLATGTHQPFANMPNDGDPAYYVPDAPTLMELANQQGGASALVTNGVIPTLVGRSAWPGVGSAVPVKVDVRFTGEDGSEATESDAATLGAALATLAAAPGGVVLANLRDVDRSGHFDTPEAYAGAVTELDAPLVDTWRAIEADDRLAGRTVLVVLSDHGRGRYGEGEPWRYHGDECRGCRDVPLLLLGPGVERGSTVEGAWSLADVAATVAHLLGVDQPLGRGRVITGALARPPTVAGPQGTRERRVTHAHELDLDFVDDPARRSVIRVDGETLSAEEAWEVGSPDLVEGGGRAFACWNELVLDAAAQRLPWRARCAGSLEGSWTTLGFPVPAVGPFLRRAAAADDAGTLWLAFNDNALGGIVDDDTGEWLQLWSWSPDSGWRAHGDGVPGVVFGEGVGLAVDDTGAWVSVVTSYAKGSALYERHLEVWRAGGDTWTRVLPQAEAAAPTRLVDSDGGVWSRQESSAITVHGGVLHVLTTAYGELGTQVLHQSSSDGGQTWSAVTALDADARVNATVRARLDGNHAWWTRVEADGAPAICRVDLSSFARACIPVEGAVVGDLVPDPSAAGEAQYTAASGARTWAVHRAAP